MYKKRKTLGVDHCGGWGGKKEEEEEEISSISEEWWVKSLTEDF